MKIGFTTKGFNKLNSVLKQENIEKAILNTVHRKANDVAGKARENANFVKGYQTSELKNSIRVVVEKDGDLIVAKVFTDCPHANYVEFGTGPKGEEKGHPLDDELNIARKQDKWLGKIPFLVSENDSGWRWIEGQEAQPFMYPAIKDEQDAIIKALGDMIKVEWLK